jgi:hypothetical protein
MNGKAMIVWQAALAFTNHICLRELSARSPMQPDRVKRVAATMYQAW